MIKAIFWGSKNLVTSVMVGVFRCLKTMISVFKKMRMAGMYHTRQGLTRTVEIVFTICQIQFYVYGRNPKIDQIQKLDNASLNSQTYVKRPYKTRHTHIFGFSDR